MRDPDLKYDHSVVPLIASSMDANLRWGTPHYSLKRILRKEDYERLQIESGQDDPGYVELFQALIDDLKQATGG